MSVTINIALSLLSQIMVADSTPNKTHFRFEHDRISAATGELSLSIPFISDFDLCPNFFEFAAIIGKTKDAYSVTVTDSRMKIKAGRATGSVDCIDGAVIHYCPRYAEKMWVECDLQLFFEAAKIARVVSSANAANVFEAALLAGDKSLIGTNRNVVIEAYHGLPLQEKLAIPLEFFDKVQRISNLLKLQPCFVGYDDRTFSIKYENGVTFSTQLYDASQFPDMENILAEWLAATEFLPLPSELIDGLQTFIKFNEKETNAIIIDNFIANEAKTFAYGMSDELSETTLKIKAETWLKFLPYCDTVSALENNRVICLSGKNMRVIASKLRV